jgi:hypothetical protein
VRARREDVDWTRRDDDLRGSVDDSGRRAANAISVVVMGQCAENCGLIGERRDLIFAPFFGGVAAEMVYETPPGLKSD